MFKLVKRLFDILFSTLVLVMVMPVLLLGIVLVYTTSKGPIFFFQERLGLNEKVFKVFKLRTMTHKIRKTHVQVYEGNPEVTWVGYYLRKYKVDELPQFINVLIGDMSVVGPRPCLPNIQHLYDENTKIRFKVKPGITSLTGVKGSIYLTWPQKWYYDKVYVEKQSLWFDIKIIFKTIFVVLMGEKRFLEVPKNTDL